MLVAFEGAVDCRRQFFLSSRMVILQVFKDIFFR
jgi:hypothetical protein